MRLKCLACEVLARMVYVCAGSSPHPVDVELFKLGLHSDPDQLRVALQDRINQLHPDDYDGIVLGYGLCGKAIEGIEAKSVPIVIPRAHDCITLFLGSRQRYQQEFEKHPGTYWFAEDYFQRNKDTAVALGESAQIDTAAVYQQYVDRYGKENADYLMQVMHSWEKNYSRAVFVDMGLGRISETLKRQAGETASSRGWTFEEVAGDLLILRKLLTGEWDDDFLVLKPGEKVQMSLSDCIIDRNNRV